MSDDGDRPGEDASATRALWQMEEWLHEIAASQRITRAALQVIIGLLMLAIILACFVWLVSLNWP